MKHGRPGIRRPAVRQEGERYVLLAVLCFLPLLRPAPAGAQSADSLRLMWTAPADNPGSSPVARYDARLSTSPLNDANFTNATVIPTNAPHAPGVRETLVVRNLRAGTTYWIAIRSADGAGNWSALSNVLRYPPSADTSPPPTPTGLQAALSPSADAVTLVWQPSSAPDLAGYLVFRATDPAGPWTQLTPVLIGTTLYSDGSLPPGGTRLYYAVTASDLAGNASPLSAATAIVLHEGHTTLATPWSLRAAYPNPAHAGRVQHLPLDSPGDASTGQLEILDSAGRVVRHFQVTGSPGARPLDWDGANDRGLPCAPGVYRAVLTVGGMKQSIRIARVP